jgi:hypothetical protein
MRYILGVSFVALHFLLPGLLPVVSANEFQDKIPSLASYEEAILVMERIYSFSNINSTVFGTLSTVFTPLYFQETEGGTQSIIVTSKASETLYVCFRGTDGEGGDVSADLAFAFVPYGDEDSDSMSFTAGRVHMGFNSALFGQDKLYLKLDLALLESVKQFPNYRVVICGHSLGAAIAVLYGGHVAYNVLPAINISALTIGCPRVGDLKLKDSFRALPNLATWRLVYQDDIIARLPLQVQAFQHIGHLILLRDSKSGAYYQQGGDASQFAGVPDRLWKVNYDFDNLLVLVFDHFPWSYLRGLDRAKVNGWWPVQFVPKSEEEQTCCAFFLVCLYKC